MAGRICCKSACDKSQNVYITGEISKLQIKSFNKNHLCEILNRDFWKLEFTQFSSQTVAATAILRSWLQSSVLDSRALILLGGTKESDESNQAFGSSLPRYRGLSRQPTEAGRCVTRQKRDASETPLCEAMIPEAQSS